jgi:signal transduction histidine kinase
MSTAPNPARNHADFGMELHDLLADRQFLGRSGDSNRAAKHFEALQLLTRVFAEDPQVVLQKLVDIAVEFCGADSSGISLEEPDEQGNLRFRWIVVSGSFAQYVNGTTQRFFSPCGTCLSTGRPLHYRLTKPFYDLLGVVAEPITDGILIPWKSDEKQGTIWAVSHGSPENFSPDDYKLLNTLADFAGISVRLAERDEALKKSNDKLELQVEQRTASLRQLSAHLLRVQDEERRKIAREIHDSLGQYLAAVKMNLAQLERQSAPPDSPFLSDSIQLLDQCLSETRTISHLLHPPLLDESGLRSAAQWYVEGFSKRSGIAVHLQIDEQLGRLPQDVETALFRVLQESLTNVHRHAGSDKVDISIQLDGQQVAFSIRDYGAGFSSQRLKDVRVGRAGGLGLTGLRERIAALGGTFEVAPASPGASITVKIPLTTPLSA